MKKCPFCKADIEDNAKFCLYCMTSLNEKKTIKTKSVKNKRWLIILAAFLCFAVVIGIVFNCFPEQAKPIKDVFVSNTTSAQKVTNQKGKVIQDKTDSNGDATSSENENTFQEEKSQGKDESKNKQKTSSSTKNSQTKKNVSTQNNEVITSASSPQVQDKTTTSTKAVVSSVTYVYRAAKQGDDFSVSYPTENCVVITDVTTKSNDGVYVIPEKLGGKNVIAIMGGAFCNSNISSSVKKVVVPSSVKTIWNYAFSSCYNLSDIYFKGGSIYTEANAFANKSSRNATLTIHCSANCSDRNFRYYKNCADDYDAKYKEWNGGAYN